jgi:hypothetical protein
MFVELVNRFRTITNWTELVNKKIQQIDLCLLEVYFVNNDRFSLAKGSFKREIRYQGIDGRLRKTDDRMQFEINMGESLPEPVSLLNAELKTDYFIFQPGEIGESSAILEQGFLLIVRKLETDPPPLKNRSLRVNSIINQGKDSVVLKLPVEFPVPLIQPKCFNGMIHFGTPNQPPVVDGEITGIITYRNYENSLQEIKIQESVSLLVNALTPGLDQSFLICGFLNDISWKPGSAERNWLMELKLDYQWYLTEPKELVCEEILDEYALQTQQIKTSLMLGTRCFDFTKTFLIPLHEPATDVNINLENVSYSNKSSQNGILLSAVLTWGIIFTHSDGYEKYQEFQTQIDEVLSDNHQGDLDVKLITVADLKVKVVNFDMVGNELKINVNCRYSLKSHINQIMTVIEDSASQELIYATILVGHQSFSLPEEEVFVLRRSPLKIVGVKTRLLQVKSEVKNGWLGVNGLIEVAISYIDCENVFREDVFKSFFQENYIWDNLNYQTNVEIEGKLSYDTYDLRNTNIFYKYLLSFSADAFKEQELRIATVKNSTGPVIQRLNILQNEEIQPPSICNLIIEGEIPLKQGNVREIATSRALLSQFDYQNSHNAILVSGNLCGEIEYWDDEQYLQKEILNFPFWRFIRNDFGRQLESSKWIPEVRNYCCFPVKTRPWSKGSIKIRFELEFIQRAIEGENK